MQARVAIAKYLAALILTAEPASSMTQSPTPDPVILHESDSGRAVTLAPSQIVEARLTMGAGTQYYWMLHKEFSVRVLRAEPNPGATNEKADAPVMAGGPVEQSFRFTAIAQGETTLSFTMHGPPGTSRANAREILFKMVCR